MTTTAPLGVLVVDDDLDTRTNMCDILEMDGHEVTAVGTMAEVLARHDWSRYAVILLDRKLPDGSAEELLPRLHELAPRSAVLIITGHGDLEGAIAALRQGAADYILKPINAEALRASLLRIADRRELALAKERSEAAFRTLVEAAPCLIVILSADHAIIYFSPYAEVLTGCAGDAVVGRDFLTTFLPEEHRPAAAERFRKALEGAILRGSETPVLCRDGSLRWLLLNARPLPDPPTAFAALRGSGAALNGPAVLLVGQDITALKQAQERTLQAERLAAIGQMVTGLAHESGNALARSQACLEMLLLEVQDRPEALDLVARIQKAQDHLRQLYEEVRNYAAPLRLERQLCGLDTVWRQAWANLAVQRQGRQAHLHEHTAGLDLRCSLDPFRLEQVFRNILENALAACRDPVEISVFCQATSLHGQPAVRVSVRDNGPGLNGEQRRRLFEPFYTTKTKGTGLGMAIARRIVEAHGGDIVAGRAGPPGADIQLTLPRENT
jgi:PAS domain S-box-containing protein